MEVLSKLFSACVDLMQLEFTVYGFTLSWWDVFIWSALAGVAGWLIVRFFYD